MSGHQRRAESATGVVIPAGERIRTLKARGAHLVVEPIEAKKEKEKQNDNPLCHSRNCSLHICR